MKSTFGLGSVFSLGDTSFGLALTPFYVVLNTSPLVLNTTLDGIEYHHLWYCIPLLLVLHTTTFGIEYQPFGILSLALKRWFGLASLFGKGTPLPRGGCFLPLVVCGFLDLYPRFLSLPPCSSKSLGEHFCRWRKNFSGSCKG